MTRSGLYVRNIFKDARAIGPAARNCHQNATQKFTGQDEANLTGKSNNCVPVIASPIKLIVIDIPVTIHSDLAKAWDFGLSFS